MIKILIKHLNQTLSEGLVVELKDILCKHDFVLRDAPKDHQSIYQVDTQMEMLKEMKLKEEATQSIVLKRNGNADGMPYYHEIEQINA